MNYADIHRVWYHFIFRKNVVKYNELNNARPHGHKNNRENNLLNINWFSTVRKWVANIYSISVRNAAIAECRS